MELFTNNDWEDFKDGKLAVNCNTEEFAKEFLDVLHNKGYKWGCCELNKNSYWNAYFEKTCYRAYGNNNVITFSSLKFYKEEGFIVKSWEGESKAYLTTGQMIDMLLNNTKLKAKIVNELDTDILMIDEHYNFVWEHNKAIAKFKPFYKDRLWNIIEPPKELKKMSLHQMAKYYSSQMYNYKSELIKSVVTSRSLTETLGFTLSTEEEIDGLWTVEGVYE